jgi:hypothetical protein
MLELRRAQTAISATRAWHASLIRVGTGRLGLAGYHLVLTAYDYPSGRRIKSVEEKFFAGTNTEACEYANRFIRVMKRPHEQIVRDYYQTPKSGRSEWC